MTIMHRSQDISTHPNFHKKLFHHKLLMLEDPWMPIFEYSTGLYFNEFNEATDCSENHIPLQRHMAELHFAFIPTKIVLEDMYEPFEHNNMTAPRCRVPFYTVQSLENCVYTFEIREGFTEPLYTRHPATDIVTEHIFPYPQLPLFTMTAHPCATIFQAHSFFYGKPSLARPRIEHPLVDAIIHSLAIWWPSIPRPDDWRASSDCPPLTYSSDSARRNLRRGQPYNSVGTGDAGASC